MSAESHEERSQLLDCSDTMDSDFNVLHARLIDVGVWRAKAMLAQYNKTIVNQVAEIMAEDSKELLLFILEHWLFMLYELVDDGC